MIRRVSRFLVLSFVCLLVSGSSSLALGVDPVISKVKTGESGALTHEYIEIYNNSNEDFDITDWCVQYASASDLTKTKLYCFEPPADNVRIMLTSFTYARIATTEFIQSVSDFEADGVFSSGLSASGGHIRLLNPDQIEKDKLAWGIAANPESVAVAVHQSGFLHSRSSVPESNFLKDTNNNFDDFSEAILSLIPVSGIYEKEIVVDVCTNINGVQTEVPDDYFLENNLCVQDVCDNLDGLQSTVPPGHISPDGENCELVPLETSILTITELLPNSTSTDTGNEFIEIYNPNNKKVNLAGYKLELGPSFSKKHVFVDRLLDPFSYSHFSDLFTKLTLPNTSASLRLVNPAGEVVSETEPYTSPKDDQSWVLVDDVWQYSDQPTPSTQNKTTVVIIDGEDAGLEPCPAGKFRNPATNRCKNIETDAGLTPCQPGQERNPDTNRCRSISSGDGLVPCKAGQERNPATNRCRNIASTASTLVPCKPGQERNPATNRCRNISSSATVASANVTDVPSEQTDAGSMAIIVVIIAGALGYAVYEWRGEIAKFFKKLKP